MSDTTSFYSDEDDYHLDRCSCFYQFIFLFILLLLLILIIAGISCTAFYNLYHPHGPTFSLDSPNVTSNKKISFDITCINPNDKITFLYDPFVVTLRSKSSTLGHGTYPTFTSNAKNVRTVKIVVFTSEKLRNGLKLVLESEARVKIGRIVSKRIRIRVTCSEIEEVVGKSVQRFGVVARKCKVHFRTRFWKSTF